jgi:hypothetical protein
MGRAAFLKIQHPVTSAHGTRLYALHIQVRVISKSTRFLLCFILWSWFNLLGGRKGFGGVLPSSRRKTGRAIFRGI